MAVELGTPLSAARRGKVHRVGLTQSYDSVYVEVASEGRTASTVGTDTDL